MPLLADTSHIPIEHVILSHMSFDELLHFFFFKCSSRLYNCNNFSNIFLDFAKKKNQPNLTKLVCKIADTRVLQGLYFI